MSVVSMRELLEAGVHFGHQTRRWNPKMRRFIFTERGGIYIIDLQKTLAAAGGSTRISPATSPSAAARSSSSARRSRARAPWRSRRSASTCRTSTIAGSAGCLTNWRTISDRIDRLHELRRLKEEGQLDLLPAKERISMLGELEKLEENLGGVADMKRQPDAVFIVDLRKEQLAVREAQRLEPAGHRARRHELRSGRGRLRHPRQRRRDSLLRPDRSRDRRRHRRGTAEGDSRRLRAGAATNGTAPRRRPTRRRPKVPTRPPEAARSRRRRSRLPRRCRAEWLRSPQHSSRSSATRPARR